MAGFSRWALAAQGDRGQRDRFRPALRYPHAAGGDDLYGWRSARTGGDHQGIFAVAGDERIMSKTRPARPKVKVDTTRRPDLKAGEGTVQLAGAVDLRGKIRGRVADLLRGFLARFGWLQTARGAIGDALAAYQRFHGLPVTGELDAATAGEMARPRCGIPDPGPGGPAAYTLMGSKWPKKQITYSFSNMTGQLQPAEVRAAIRMAFDLWQDATSLEITEVQGQADILLLWASGNHGCGYP